MEDRFFAAASPDWYPLLKDNARKNRENPTEAEAYLWRFLKGKQLGEKFLRQYVVLDYIADFVCLKHKLIIEVDGGYHLQSDQQRLDEQRTHRLESIGYNIIRYSNEEVLFDIERVIESIKNKIKSQ